MASGSCPPIQLWILLLIVMMLLVTPWYLSSESVLEDTRAQYPLTVMILPIVIVLMIRCLSSRERPPTSGLGGGSGRAMPRNNESGGSPWGVAFMVFLVLLMVSYQSAFHQQWLPFWTRH